MSEASKDPAGDPVRDAWTGLGDALTQLGQAMKDRYLGAGAGAGGADPSGSAQDAPAGGAASTDGLRDALDRFVAAGRDVGQRASDVVRDPGVNSQARHAASSLTDALQATVDVVGREVAGWFGQAKPVAEHPDDVIDVDPDRGPPT